MTSLTDPITIGKLRWAPLLSVLTDEEFQAFVNDARIIDFNIGDVIDSGTTDNAALWILMSGTARLAEPGAGNRTLSVLTEPGAFWSAELARRANVSAPSLIASGKTSVLNIQAASIAALGRRSEKFEAKLDLESSILRSFLRLRATARFSDLDFSRFRPFLSQGGCISFGAGELFDRSLPHDGISIVTDPRFQPVVLPDGRILMPAQIPASAQAEARWHKVPDAGTATVSQTGTISVERPLGGDHGPGRPMSEYVGNNPITPETQQMRNRSLQSRYQQSLPLHLRSF